MIGWERSGVLLLIERMAAIGHRNVNTFYLVSLHSSEREPQPTPGEETEPFAGLLNLRGADFVVAYNSVDADLVHL